MRLHSRASDQKRDITRFEGSLGNGSPGLGRNGRDVNPFPPQNNLCSVFYPLDSACFIVSFLPVPECTGYAVSKGEGRRVGCNGVTIDGFEMPWAEDGKVDFAF